MSDAAAVRETALRACRAGLSIIPPLEDGSKRPDGEWKQFQSVAPTESQVEAFYETERTGVGFITGTVSGRLEVLDFDDAATFEAYRERAREAGLGELIEEVVAGYCERTPGGVHVFYRCADIEGNQKLARRSTDTGIKALVETRGEGGFVISAPTHGSVHESGKPYVQLSGSVESIVRITPDERESLLELARSFDEMPRESRENDPPRPRANGGMRPGDEFNARASWEDVLESHGWVRVFERGGEVYWRRPGKANGISATTNYNGSGLLYVFSTSTPFESERGYDKFGAYSVLEHGGDIGAAARVLAKGGYGAADQDGVAGQHAAVDDDHGLLEDHVLLDHQHVGAAEHSRVEVCLTGRQLAEQVDDALAVLRLANDPPEVFERGGQLVRVRRDENGAPTIQPLGTDGLLEALARAADWTRRDADGKTRATNPTRALAGVVAAAIMRGGNVLPGLRGLIEAPLLRADGSILDAPGYDIATALYYAPEPDFSLAEVPEHPTDPELEAAKALLFEELLGEFPFTSEADTATALAALITVVLRDLIVGSTPAFMVDAPAPGTGKSLLAKLFSIVASGRPPTMMSPAGDRDDAEWRKRITSALLLGGAVAVVDNLEEPIGSPALASALTAETWTDRVLGKSELTTLPARAVWVLTGNNLRLRGDLPRRCVWCRLDAKRARPWTRDGFRHPDLLAWAKTERGRILAAVFTLARAWVDANRPGPLPEVPKLGGFEAWRHVVGGMLLVAGVRGFLGNLEALYAEIDDDTPAWAGFLEAWADTTSAPVTSAQLAQRMESRDALRDALPPDLSEAWERWKAGKGSFTRRLGKALARKRDVRIAVSDERTLVVVRHSEQDRAVRWQVRGDEGG